MRIACVVGARPNFVKIAPLLREMRRYPVLEARLIHTGQHYDAAMSDSFFRDLEIPPPDVSLGVRPEQLASETKAIIARLEPVLTDMKPDLVLVVGDVNSTLAAALVASKAGIPVAHVEAGLRSFDRSMPEEINRIHIDGVSDVLFVSEASGVENLRKEGISRDRIFLVGNVMIDSLRSSLAKACASSILKDLGLADHVGLPPRRPYALLTLHRQGLVDNPHLFLKVWEALEALAREMHIIFPVHPRTQLCLRELGIESSFATGAHGDGLGIRMIGPLGYLQFLHLEQRARLVMTDSGGVQEESSAMGVPCLTLRENTERPITVTEGTNTVVGLDPERILKEARCALAGPPRMLSPLPLWDGHASRRIVEILCTRAARSQPMGRATGYSIPPRWVVEPGDVATARLSANHRALAGI